MRTPLTHRPRAGTMAAASVGLFLLILLTACSGASSGPATPPAPVPGTAATTTGPATTGPVTRSTTGTAPGRLDLARLSVTDGGSRQDVRTPSGNIACTLTTETGDEVTCEIFTTSWRTPPSTTSPCTGEPHGAGLALDVAGVPGIVCLGQDMRVARFRVLPVGHAVRVGADVCASLTTGMTCQNLTSGRGFTLGREAYRLT